MCEARMQLVVNSVVVSRSPVHFEACQVRHVFKYVSRTSATLGSTPSDIA